MIWGGRAKAGKKNSTATRSGNKVHRLVAEEIKTQHEFSARPPPRSLMVRPLGFKRACQRRGSGFKGVMTALIIQIQIGSLDSGQFSPGTWTSPSHRFEKGLL